MGVILEDTGEDSIVTGGAGDDDDWTRSPDWPGGRRWPERLRRDCAKNGRCSGLFARLIMTAAKTGESGVPYWVRVTHA